MLIGVGKLLELRDCVRSCRGPWRASVAETSGGCVLPMAFWWYEGSIKSINSVCRFSGGA
jgi:hypothetical protein